MELSNNLFFSWHRPTRALFQDLDPEVWNQTTVIRAWCCAVSIRKNSIARPPIRLICSAIGRCSTPLMPTSRLASTRGRAIGGVFLRRIWLSRELSIYSAAWASSPGITARPPAMSGSISLRWVALHRGLTSSNRSIARACSAPITSIAIRATCRSRQCAMPMDNGCACRCRLPAAPCTRAFWRAKVGRVSVYLLDTNCPENSPEDRDITHRLYGGDGSVRIRQEMVSGARRRARAARAGSHTGRLAHQ